MTLESCPEQTDEYRRQSLAKVVLVFKLDTNILENKSCSHDKKNMFSKLDI